MTKHFTRHTVARSLQSFPQIGKRARKTAPCQSKWKVYRAATNGANLSIDKELSFLYACQSGGSSEATGRLYVEWIAGSWETTPLLSSESCTLLAHKDNIDLVSLDQIFHTTYVLFLMVLLYSKRCFRLINFSLIHKKEISAWRMAEHSLVCQQHGRAELRADYCVSNTVTEFDYGCRPPASTYTRVAGNSKSASSLPCHLHLSVLIKFVCWVVTHEFRTHVRFHQNRETASGGVFNFNYF